MIRVVLGLSLDPEARGEEGEDGWSLLSTLLRSSMLGFFCSSFPLWSLLSSKFFSLLPFFSYFLSSSSQLLLSAELLPSIL